MNIIELKLSEKDGSWIDQSMEKKAHYLYTVRLMIKARLLTDDAEEKLMSCADAQAMTVGYSLMTQSLLQAYSAMSERDPIYGNDA